MSDLVRILRSTTPFVELAHVERWYLKIPARFHTDGAGETIPDPAGAATIGTLGLLFPMVPSYSSV